jgi:hypothetical protein
MIEFLKRRLRRMRVDTPKAGSRAGPCGLRFVLAPLAAA